MKIHADEKIIKKLPKEEILSLIRENKLIFVGIKALLLWKEKNKENGRE